MSYTIAIYHPSVRSLVESGQELDEFEHPPLDPSAVARFIDTLAQYGYGSEPSTAECRAFVKDVSGCPVQVHVFTTEIAFSVPTGRNSEDAVFEALQDASELVDAEHMSLFDPQTGEWTDA